MSLITREELSAFLAANGNPFINEAGMEISSHEEWGIGSSHSWRRYLNGYAEIAVEHHLIEASLIFRLYKSRTLVTSLEMHFYDEVCSHLTMPEEFLDYLVKRERSLQTANEHRYKY